MNVLLCLVLQVCFSEALRFLQTFDAVVDGTANATLADGSTIVGTAVAAKGGLTLTQIGAEAVSGTFRTPHLRNTSLGWAASFDFSLVAPRASGAPPADGIAFVFANKADLGALVIQRAPMIAADAKFVAFVIDTFGDAKSPSGVYFFDHVTKIRRGSMTTPLRNGESRNGTFFAALTPNGLSFRTTGLGSDVDVDIADVPTNVTAGDDWMFFVVGETGGQTEFAAIDNVLIDVPCGDCDCVWKRAGEFHCLTRETTTTTTTTTETTATTTEARTMAPPTIDLTRRGLSANTTNAPNASASTGAVDQPAAVVPVAEIVGGTLAGCVLLAVALSVVLCLRKRRGAEKFATAQEPSVYAKVPPHVSHYDVGAISLPPESVYDVGRL